MSQILASVFRPASILIHTAGPTFVAACGVFMLIFFCGCQNQSHLEMSADESASAPTALFVMPPPGWVEKPPRVSEQSTTRVWVSPTGETALGEIRFTLPFPVGHEWALWGFLKNMKQSEGRADLIEKQWDAKRNALRFTADGGRYRVRTHLFVRGSAGVAVFAGTLLDRPINEAELLIAEQARDVVNVP
jgi:hypothetical protein